MFHPSILLLKNLHLCMSSSHLTFSLQSYQPGCLDTNTAALMSLHTERKTSHAREAYNSIMPTWVILTEVKSEKHPSEVAFLLSAALNLLYKCVQDIYDRAVPHWGFYGEIKENQGGYLQLSWHSKSEDGVDCSPLIEDTFERCLTACQLGLQLTRQHWSKRDLQWLG